MDKTRPNRKVLAVAGALLLPPAWIVFDGVQHLAGVPAPVALFTIGAMIAASVTLVWLGLANLRAGDVREAAAMLGVAGLILLAEFVGQWWFAISENHALVTALIFSMLSLAGGVILEGEIMRVYKANGRTDGTITLARARVPGEIKKRYPEVAELAELTATRYPNATQESVLAKAFADWDQLRAERAVKPQPQIRVDVRDLVAPTAAPAIESGSAADTSGDDAEGSAPELHSVPVPLGASGSVSALVRTFWEAGVTDDARIVEAVVRIKPDANPESIRKYARGIRSKEATA